MSRRPRALILADLAEILSNFHGREFSGEIGPDTMFFADLGLASIDAVVLGERLQAHYKQPIPFTELMGDLGGRTDRDLRMGDLADFLHRHLSADEDPSGRQSPAAARP